MKMNRRSKENERWKREGENEKANCSKWHIKHTDIVLPRWIQKKKEYTEIELYYGQQCTWYNTLRIFFRVV